MCALLLGFWHRAQGVQSLFLAPLAKHLSPLFGWSQKGDRGSGLRCCLGAAEKKMGVVCINPDISCQAVSRLGRSPWLQQGYGAPPLAGRHTLSGEARFRRGGKQFEKTVLGALASWRPRTTLLGSGVHSQSHCLILRKLGIKEHLFKSKTSDAELADHHPWSFHGATSQPGASHYQIQFLSQLQRRRRTLRRSLPSTPNFASGSARAPRTPERRVFFNGRAFFFSILACECASCHRRIHFFWKLFPKVALTPFMISTFWLVNLRRAAAAFFLTIMSQSSPNLLHDFNILTCKLASRHSRSLFFGHQNFPKPSPHIVRSLNSFDQAMMVVNTPSIIMVISKFLGWNVALGVRLASDFHDGSLKSLNEELSERVP